MKFTKTIKPGMDVSYNTDGDKVVFNDTNDDIHLELHMDDFKSAISHIIEAIEMHHQNEPKNIKEIKELNQDTSQLVKEDEGRYIELTKEVLNVPVGTLGVIDYVFNDDERAANDPYVGIVSTLVKKEIALASDEFQFVTVGDETHE